MEDSNFLKTVRNFRRKKYIFKEELIVSKSIDEIKKIIDEHTEKPEDEIQLKTDSGFVQDDEEFCENWIDITYRRKKVKSFDGSVNKYGLSNAVCLAFDSINKNNTKILFYYNTFSLKFGMLISVLIGIFFGLLTISKGLAFEDYLTLTTKIVAIVFMSIGVICAILIYMMFKKTPYEFIATEIKSWFGTSVSFKK